MAEAVLRVEVEVTEAEPSDYAAQEALRAWTVPGPAPRRHALAQRRLRQEWPALAGALDLMAATAIASDR